MYGVFPGMWYFAPGSKSSSVRTTGGDIPWYPHLKHWEHQNHISEIQHEFKNNCVNWNQNQISIHDINIIRIPF